MVFSEEAGFQCYVLLYATSFFSLCVLIQGHGTFQQFWGIPRSKGILFVRVGSFHDGREE